MENTVLIEGVRATDGRVDNVSSYRSEMCGNIAKFAVFTVICKVYAPLRYRTHM
jgi:hypothetical protein